MSATEQLQEMISELKNSITNCMVIYQDPTLGKLVEDLDILHEVIGTRTTALTKNEIEEMAIKIQDIAICAFPPSPQDQHTNDPPPIN